MARTLALAASVGWKRFGSLSGYAGRGIWLVLPLDRAATDNLVESPTPPTATRRYASVM